MEYDFDDDFEKQEIISRSPLLRAILDETVHTDREMWAEKLVAETEPVVAEIQKVFGEKNFAVLVWTLTNYASMEDVFEDNDNKMNPGAITLMAAAGYQIGNIEDCVKVDAEVMEQLIGVRILKNPPTVPEYETIFIAVRAAISSGVALRTGMSDEPTDSFPEDDGDPANDPNIPDVFKKFFKGRLDNL